MTREFFLTGSIACPGIRCAVGDETAYKPCFPATGCMSVESSPRALVLSMATAAWLLTSLILFVLILAEPKWRPQLNDLKRRERLVIGRIFPRQWRLRRAAQRRVAL